MGTRRAHSYFHLHLVSDSTGETLLTVTRAAAARYPKARAIEHVYSLIRSQNQLESVMRDIEEAPGIVLYTLVDEKLGDWFEKKCAEISCPCVSVLDPVLNVFRSYLGVPQTTPRAGAQHVLDTSYFKRIDALNYTLFHDDGQSPSGLSEADIVLVGVSRTSKTPTSIYLANRGLKVSNIPLVPHVPVPKEVKTLTTALVVGLVASPDRIRQIRQNRLLAMQGEQDDSYVDQDAISDEIAFSRKLFASNNWPVIDVTRRSIEETAAGILQLWRKHKEALETAEHERAP